MIIDGENLLECKICGSSIESFPNKIDLQIHLINIHKDQSLQCLECGKFFSSIVYLKQHVTKTHVDFNLECELCDKKFKTKIGFSKHKIRHFVLKEEVSSKLRNDPDEDEQKCLICNDSFDKYNLEAHMLTHNETVTILPKVKCDICDKDCASQQSLNTHKLLNHKEERKYLCDLCNKSFVKNDKYQKHLKMHQDDRTFK